MDKELEDSSPSYENNTSYPDATVGTRGIPTTGTTPSNPHEEILEKETSQSTAADNVDTTTNATQTTTKEPQMTTNDDNEPSSEAAVATQEKDPGNDQVSVDQPKQPLVVVVASVDERKPPPPSSETILKGVVALNGTTTIPTVVPPPVATDPKPVESLEDEGLRQEREPLTSLYGPFIAPTDTCLQDARERLQTALRQTHSLRVAFTERVYGKYRVCLKAPQDIPTMLKSIQSDPSRLYQKLQTEIQNMKQEKDLEKKAAHKMVDLPLEVDHAEQLMYMSAGLNLVILPEQTSLSALELEKYPERGPMESTSGQRVKSISQAAATAGSVMLERTRKAAALRVERQRQRQLQLLSGEQDSLTIKPLLSSTVQRPVKKSSSLRSSHSIITTPHTASLSASTLLSLNPQADELNKTTRNSSAASTAALVGNSGCVSKTTQQRLRHPFPESLGGRRRANMNNMAAAVGANLALTLPPLPKERRKPLPVLPNPAVPRARQAVQSVLESFEHNNRVTKIRLLHSLSKFGISESSVESDETPEETTDQVDPVIAFSVLHAVGLIGQQQQQQQNSKSSSLLPDQPVNDKLKELREQLLGSQRQTLTQTLWSPASEKPPSKRVETAKEESQKDVEENDVERPSKRQRVDDTDGASNGEATPQENPDTPMPDRTAEEISKPSNALSVEIIRGGGEVLLDSTDETDASQEKTRVEKSSESGSKDKKGEPSSKIEKPKRRRSYSESTGQAAIAEDRNEAQGQPNAEGSLAYLNSQMPASSTAQSVAGYFPADRYRQNATLNALHLAQQLRQGTNMPLRHPAGDIFLGRMHQQQHGGYDLSSFIPSGMNATQSQLAALGQLRQNQGLVGYSMEDREVAARALYAREQQTTALLRGAAGYTQPAAAPFAHAGAQSAAMSALLGSSASGGLLGRSQYGGQMPNPLSLYRSSSEASGKHNTEQKGSEPIDKPRKESEKITASVKTAASPSRNPKDGQKNEHGRDHMPSDDSVPADASANSEIDREKPAEAKEDNSEPVQEDEDSSDDDTDAQEENQASQSDEHGMRFFSPKRPGSIGEEKASLVRAGRFSEAIADVSDTSTRVAVLEYLVSVGTAVPIPKALVLGPLKERLNTPGFKNSGSGAAPPIPRDIVVSAILVWLWAHHEQNFQQAFEKSGRIDVDTDCKWLIQAAVDTSVRDLTLEIADSMARGEGPFAEASAARKASSSGANKQGSASHGSEPVRSAVSKKVEIHTASVVARALMTELCIDSELDSVLHHYQPLVEYLDEARLCALRAKSQERVLLATLLARRATMAESFSHAYVSAIVRAGEALGHGKLFEAVQNEDVMASTMIPYDIFTDDTDAWEDPCKPDDGFTAGQSADDLVRRAHARAMIQKSLRKLQDRHNIRGGASSYGPYTDPSSTDTSGSSPSGGTQGSSAKLPPAPSPRAGLKRKLSAISEPPVQHGTGSAEARSWNVYDPRHFSAPLEWEGEQTENLPYGRHSKGDRARSVSLSLSARSGEPKSGKKARRSMSISAPPLYGSTKDDKNSKIPRSTHEIDWADVAGIFQRVELPRKSPSARSSRHEASTASAADGTIIAPFCQRLDHEFPSEDDSDSEEDLSEETVLARHQVVLDDMKEKLSAFLEARKRQQERRKNRYKGKP